MHGVQNGEEGQWLIDDNQKLELTRSDETAASSKKTYRPKIFFLVDDLDKLLSKAIDIFSQTEIGAYARPLAFR